MAIFAIDKSPNPMKYRGVTKLKQSISPLALVTRREILEWRDNHKLSANFILTRRWQDMKPQIEAKLEEITWYKAAVSPSDYITQEIDPILKAGIEESVAGIVKNAQSDLLSIMDHQLNEISSPGPVQKNNSTSEELTEIFTSFAPLAGGLALGAAVPSMAVVSGSVAFGLVATSTVSMPILLGGLAVAGGAVATGVVKTSNLRRVRSARMMKRIKDHVDQAVFSLKRPGEVSRPISLLLQIHDAIDSAVEVALGEIDDRACNHE